MGREVTASWLGNLKAEVRVGAHRVAVDEPPEQGGEDTGPTPSELLLAALTA